MDADRGDGGDGGVASSPMDVLADLFRRKYTLPVFLVSTASIFLLVHLAGGPDGDSFARYDRGGGGGADRRRRRRRRRRPSRGYRGG